VAAAPTTTAAVVAAVPVVLVVVVAAVLAASKDRPDEERPGSADPGLFAARRHESRDFIAASVNQRG
jgi:hypothetical protein